jgi:hypothetical protein
MQGSTISSLRIRDGATSNRGFEHSTWSGASTLTPGMIRYPRTILVAQLRHATHSKTRGMHC